jgi:hypothetical protein
MRTDDVLKLFGHKIDLRCGSLAGYLKIRRSGDLSIMAAAAPAP